jgi:hypothetical protein
MIRTFLLRFLQRSPAIRFLMVPVIFLLFTLLISGVTALINKKPVLESISPSIGESGEILVLQGKHFGDERGDNWIEIGGNRLSGTSFVQWTDTTVMTLLSPTVEDGLVYVVNRYGKSNPLIFANKKNIPVAARVDSELGLPEILSADTVKTEIGRRLVIYGKNFGLTKNESTVLFSWRIDPAIPALDINRTNELQVACSEHDFDYEFWSDIELRVRVPDGAASGNMYVKTDRGVSNPLSIQIVNQPGTKKYVNRHTYALSLQADITGVTASDGNMLFLRIPVPETTASQRDVEVTESTPKPYMDDYRGMILHQIENLKTGRNEKIAHSFLLTNYGVTTAVNPALVKPYADAKSPLYLMYTAADKIVPSDSGDIVLQSAAITGKETNPYLKAKLIYAWITSSIRLTAVENPDRPVADALREKSGDAYDMALLFCALARAAGIPSVPVAGIIVDGADKSRLHWWAEFYIESFGWVPIDPGLESEMKDGIPASAHFGNIDAAHIAFSRDYVDEKPMSAKSRIVYRPRSFAFQPIWEESSGNIKSYTSFWGEPKATGVY